MLAISCNNDPIFRDIAPEHVEEIVEVAAAEEPWSRLSIYAESLAVSLDRYELPGQTDHGPEPTSPLALEVQLYRSTERRAQC